MDFTIIRLFTNVKVINRYQQFTFVTNICFTKIKFVYL